jgi:hypothetical protein
VVLEEGQAMEWMQEWLLTTPTPVILLIALVIAMGVHYLLAFRRGQRRVRATAHWVSVRGTITAARVDAAHSTHGADLNTTDYAAAITYTYSFGKHSYTGSRLHLGERDRERSRRSTAREVARYTPGATVEVFYDPANPKEAVLQRRAPLPAIWKLYLLVALMLSLSSVAAWWVGRR